MGVGPAALEPGALDALEAFALATHVAAQEARRVAFVIVVDIFEAASLGAPHRRAHGPVRAVGRPLGDDGLHCVDELLGVLGTKLLYAVVTSDMRNAEAVMLASLRSADAVAEGIEAMKKKGWGDETFRGPYDKIEQRVTEAARLFPAAPHNLLSEEAAREWYERARAAGDVAEGVGIRQFLIDNECPTDVRDSTVCAQDAEESSDHEDVSNARELGAQLMARPECRTLIDEGRAEELKAKMEREKLSDVEEQQLWVHKMVHLYRLRATPGDELDGFVLDKLVGAHLPRSAAREMERRHNALRRFEAARRADGGSGMRHDDVAATEVSKLMDRIAPRWRDAILADESLSVTNASLRGHIASWLQDMTDQTYIKMMRELGIQLKSDKGCHTRSKLMNIMSTEEGSDGSDDSRAGSKATRPGRAATELLNNMLSKAFGIELASPKKSAKGKRNIDASLYKGLKGRVAQGSPFSDA